MLRQYVPVRHHKAPLHQPGEVVLALVGNYLERRTGCVPKLRPAILLQITDCQHLAAGLTTQATAKITGEPRPELPGPRAIGLDGRRSYLWSPRPSFICRLDVRQHLGWIDRHTVEFLADHLRLDKFTLAALWQLAGQRSSNPSGGKSWEDTQNDQLRDDAMGQRPRQPR